MPVALSFVAGRILDVKGEPRPSIQVLFIPAPGDEKDPYYQSRKQVIVTTTALGKFPDSDPSGHLNAGVGLIGGKYKIRISKTDVYTIKVPSDGGSYSLTSLIVT